MPNRRAMRARGSVGSVRECTRGELEIGVGESFDAGRHALEQPALSGSAPLRLGVRDLGVKHDHGVAGDEPPRITPLELELELALKLECRVPHE